MNGDTYIVIVRQNGLVVAEKIPLRNNTSRVMLKYGFTQILLCNIYYKKQ